MDSDVVPMYIAEDGEVIMEMEAEGDGLPNPVEGGSSKLSECTTQDLLNVSMKAEPGLAAESDIWDSMDSSGSELSKCTTPDMSVSVKAELGHAAESDIWDVGDSIDSVTKQETKYENANSSGDNVDTEMVGTDAVSMNHVLPDTYDNDMSQVLGQFPDDMDAEIDLNQIQYVQDDIKVEKFEPQDEQYEHNDLNSEIGLFGNMDNSTELPLKIENCIKSENFSDLQMDPNFSIKTENLDNLGQPFCDTQPTENYTTDSDSESEQSSCPSVLEEFSTFPENVRSPSPENVPDESIWPESRASSLASDSDHSEDDNIYLTRENSSLVENSLEAENSALHLTSGTNEISEKFPVKDYKDFKPRPILPLNDPLRKQKRAENILRGDVKVLSVSEVNSIRARIPNQGRLIEILTIIEDGFAVSGVTRYKITYSRRETTEVSRTEQYSFVLQCKQIVEQVRAVHDAKIGDKVGAAFAGIARVNPKHPSDSIPFQVMYVWTLNQTSSYLHILDIEGLDYVMRPFRLGEFANCNIWATDDRVCALFFNERQVVNSELSPCIKNVLLQIVSQQWQEKEKCIKTLMAQQPIRLRKKKKRNRGHKVKVSALDSQQDILNKVFKKRVKRVKTAKHSKSLQHVLNKAQSRGLDSILAMIGRQGPNAEVKTKRNTSSQERTNKRAFKGRKSAPKIGSILNSMRYYNTAISNSATNVPSAETQYDDVTTPSEPRAEIEFTRIKTEPNDSGGDSSLCNEPRAEIEFTRVKEEPYDSDVEPDDEVIAPISEDQVRIIMGVSKQKKQKVGYEIKKSTPIGTGASEKMSASVLMKAAKSLAGAGLLSKKRIAVIQNHLPSHVHVPNILKTSGIVPTHVEQLSSMSTASSSDTHPMTLQSTVTVDVGVNQQPFLAPAKKVIGNVNKRLLPQISKRRMRIRQADRSVPQIVDVHSENLSQFTGDDLWDKITQNSSSNVSGKSTNTLRSSIQAGIEKRANAYHAKIANANLDNSGPKIVEVHSENLSAFSGDALWEKIVQKTSAVTTCSTTTALDASSSDALWEKLVQKTSTVTTCSTTASDASSGQTLEIKTEPHDNWDSLVGANNKNHPNFMKAQANSLPSSTVSAIKAEPPDVSGNNSDSDSDHERVLLRADDVDYEDDQNEADEIDNQSEALSVQNVMFNPSFNGFSNIEPITLHIPLEAPKPQKKFFKSARDPKSKFNKEQFISSTIQKGASKYDIQEGDNQTTRKKFIKRGQRVNPNAPNVGYWKRMRKHNEGQVPMGRAVTRGVEPRNTVKEIERTYSCSLPQGGAVIRKVGIVKAPKSAGAPTKYSCHICGHSFKYSGDLRSHLKIHSEYRCEICKVDMPSKKIYVNHVTAFHSFLTNQRSEAKLNAAARAKTKKNYDNLERYFGYVEQVEDKDTQQEREWEKCYQDNGILPAQLKAELVDPVPDDESLHSSDSDVQDGDVFAPLNMNGPSESEWAKIISK